MTTRSAIRGALAGMVGARAQLALGRQNVFTDTGDQLTFGQIGDFKGPRRVAPGAYTVTGPDPTLTDGRIEPRTVDFAGALGYQLEEGTNGFVVVLPVCGQSNALAATDGADGVGSSVLYNVLPGMPGKLLCFNGGIAPTDANPGGEDALDTALTPADIATVVDARVDINLRKLREMPSYSAGLYLANALGDNDKVFLVSMAVGATDTSARVVGFKESRASGTVTITGTTASFDVSSFVATGLAGAPNLSIIGVGIDPATTIVSIDSGDPTDVCTATVSVAQNVGPVAFTTKDQRPQQYQNFAMALDAIAVWAQGQGKTAIMPFWMEIGGEAESTAVAVANALVTAADLVTVADELAARLHAGTVNAGQQPIIINRPPGAPRTNLSNDPPANNNGMAWPDGVNTPDESNMKKVSNMTLASEVMMRGVDATGAPYSDRWYSVSAYHHPADADARVHIGNDPIGHVLAAEDMGLVMVDLADGLDPRWPSIIGVQRVKGNLSVTVTFSEPCTFDTDLVVNPGQYGFRYTGGGTDVAITNFSWAGAVLTLTLASEPAGVEVLAYACGNATEYIPAKSRQSPFGAPSEGLAGGGFPFDGPGMGLGNQGGQRGNVVSVATYGYSLQTGRPMRRFAGHWQPAVDVTAGTGNLLALHTAGGVTPSFLIDAGDSASVPAGGQTFTDRSASAALYWRGVDGTSANDPADEAAAGGLPAWLRFDGGGGAGVKSGKLVTPQASPTYLADLHKAGGSAVLFAAIYMPTGPTYPTNQYILANCRNGSGGGAGVVFRISTAGNPGVTVRNASNGTVYNHNLPTASRVVAGWNVIAYGLRDGGTSWAWDSNGSKFVATKITNATAFSSPAAGAAEASPIIGGNYLAATVNIDSLVNGAGIGFVSVASWVAAEDFLPIFRSACARFGLPVGPLSA